MLKNLTLAFPWFNFDKIFYSFGSMSVREFSGFAHGISSGQGRDETTKSSDFLDYVNSSGVFRASMKVKNDFIDRKYFMPAQNRVERYGFQHTLSMLVIYDSYIHSSHIRDDRRKMFVKVLPSTGGDEKQWTESYFIAWANWLATHFNPLSNATVYLTDRFNYGFIIRLKDQFRN